MKKVAYVTALIALVVLQWAIIIKFAPTSGERVVDCSLASFHPDYTSSMRAACNKRFIKE